jgi:hypothetical protein
MDLASGASIPHGAQKLGDAASLGETGPSILKIASMKHKRKGL